MPATPDAKPLRHDALDLLMPLQFFYSMDDEPLPVVHFITGAEVPEPGRHLLVHDSDMTPRLRAHHGSAISLRVVQSQVATSFVMREVVLSRVSDGVPVEYGAIGIQLEGFPAHVRDLISAGQRPLGSILEEEGVPHTSSPRAWFQVESDDRISQLLLCPPGTLLYGRCNVLSHPDGIAFADIVEVLPR